MAGIQTIFDSFSGINRPQMNLQVDRAQQLNGLTSAQTQDAMERAQLESLQAGGAKKQQAAQDQITANLTDYLGPGKEKEATLLGNVMIGMGLKNPDQAVQMLQGMQTLGSRQTLADPTQLGSPTATAAASSIQGKIPEPVQVPNEFTVQPGAPQPIVQQTPLGAAQTGAAQALGGLHNVQAKTAQNGQPSQLDIDTMADRYNITGQLPPLGMGSSPLRAAILTSAAAQARGERPMVPQTGAAPGAPSAAGGQASNAGVFGSSKVALSAVSKQAAMVDAYEKTAGMNLDLANSYVNGPGKTLDETGSPLLNRALLHWQQHITGDPATQQFVNALTTSRDEYARVISAATGAQGITDAGRAEASNLFPDSISPAQLGPAIITAKQEMENRSQGLHAQMESLKQHLASIGGTGTSSGGGPSGSVASGATPVQGIAPPAAAPTPGTAPAGSAAGGGPQPLPPQALAALKEGQHTTFGNGQTWTLQNGQPQQVQ